VTKSAALVGVVNSLMLLAIAFGVPLSNNQQLAIGVAVNATLVAVAAWRDPQVPFGRVE
jgi:hypothetical protein